MKEMFVEVERCRMGEIALEGSAASEEKAVRWPVLALQWGL